MAKLRACVDYLMGQTDIATGGDVKTKVGVLGFCFGGTYSFELAITDARIKACSSLLWPAAATARQSRRSCLPCRGILRRAGRTTDSSGLPDLKAAMQKADKEFTVQIYPNAGHAFFNDKNPLAYNEAATKDSWAKSLAFLAKNLKS